MKIIYFVTCLKCVYIYIFKRVIRLDYVSKEDQGHNMLKVNCVPVRTRINYQRIIMSDEYNECSTVGQNDIRENVAAENV